MRTGLVIAGGVLGLLVLGPGALGRALLDDEVVLPGPLGGVRGLVAAGEWADALAAIERLEARSAGWSLFELKAQVLHEMGDADGAALAVLTAYEHSLRERGIETAELNRRRQRVESQFADAGRLLEAESDFLDSVLALAAQCFESGAHRSASELLRAVRELAPEEPRLAAMLSRFEQGGSSEAVRRLRAESVRLLPPEEVDRMDEEHRDFQNAYTLSTPHYEIRTNIGYYALHEVAAHMEQMHGFYREFYGIPPGRPFQRLGIKLYATAQEFNRHCELRGYRLRNQDAGGFFDSDSPDGPEIVAWDVRSASDLTMWPVLELLSHEASHQFMHELVKPSSMPRLLDEGVASYFEGIRILEDGSIDINYPTSEWVAYLARRARDDAPTLRELLVDVRSGDRGDQYCYGWALVYFCRNFEDAHGRRPFEKPFTDLLLGYATGSHRLVQTVQRELIDKVSFPGIDTVEDLEARMGQWFHERRSHYYEPVELAGSMVSRARARRDDRATEARRLFEQALRVAPELEEVRRELVEFLLELDQSDEAAHHLRLLLQQREDRGAPDAELVERLREMAPGGVDRHQAESQYRRQVLELAAELGDRELPQSALWALRRLRRVDTEVEVDRAIARIEEQSGLSLRRWRSVVGGPTLNGWKSERLQCFRGVGDEIHGLDDTRVTRRLMFERPFTGDYQFRCRVSFGETARHAGFLVGMKNNGEGQSLRVHWNGRIQWFDIQATGQPSPAFTWKVIKERWRSDIVRREGFDLSVEVEGDTVRYRVEGEIVFEDERPPGSLEGQFGLSFSTSGDVVRFQEPRLKE